MTEKSFCLKLTQPQVKDKLKADREDLERREFAMHALQAGHLEAPEAAEKPNVSRFHLPRGPQALLLQTLWERNPQPVLNRKLKQREEKMAAAKAEEETSGT